MARSNSSARSALGSVLGAVTAAGTSVASLFETANSGVGMLNKYVSDASEKQRIASDYELATYEEALLDNHAIDEAKRTREIQTFFAEAGDNREIFEKSYSRIKAAVAARRGTPTEASA